MEAFKEYSERFRVDPETKQRNVLPDPGGGRAGGRRHGDRRRLGGARAFTSTAGPGISPDERVHRPGVLHRDPRRLLRHSAHRPVHGHADAHAAGAICCRSRISRTATRSTSRSSPRIPEECFYLAVEAFDLAERFQTPVFVVSDLDIGMNDWMCQRFNWDDAYRPDRGKVLGRRGARDVSERSRATSTPTATASRRARCPACIRRGGYFTRGSGHDKHAAYTEDSDEYHEVVDRLTRKLATQRRRRCRRQSCI